MLADVGPVCSPITKLKEVLTMLAEQVFNGPQKFYLLIDKLDEGWVDDALRYRLIKALIEAVKDFNQLLPCVKIIVALRRDLLDRVINETRDGGFQEEKYHPLYLQLRWSSDQLLGMLDLRVNEVVKRQYTKEQVHWQDLIVQKVGTDPTRDYLIARTLYRPRDLIVFFNICMEMAEDKPDISAATISRAELIYSERRLRSLYDEWQTEHPDLHACAGLLRRRPYEFALSAIDDEAINDLCLGLATKDGGPDSATKRLAKEVAEGKAKAEAFRAHVASLFYKVGLIGLKLGTGLSWVWSFRHQETIDAMEIPPEVKAQICPMFYRALSATPTGAA